jgi:toxin ParE1/3/4
VKRYRLIVSGPAQADLHQIFDYIQADNPSAAQKFINQIDASISRLASFPLSGKMLRDESLQAKGYRVLTVEDYLAFYKVTGRKVTVLRVIQGRRNYLFLF